MRVYNDEATTLVTSGRGTVQILPKSFAELGELDPNAAFNAEDFYMVEPGDWYVKREDYMPNTDLEIYDARRPA
ncbi:hypothetical protein ASL14_26405 (plasmid) [Paenibacillus sp. IHB B 3084]|uniref:hypothetical protein n=1 Tax=Paenibacillus sp. IHB B 3084 TaxID=867076 RepID=UPI000721D61E|nr:hypothetical protein [Paenibacillus sp. IHB B 3084]ALP39409.1 hypothetical protein ASL14_26405 [Paenibacillus sp. IHB B 3084]